MRLLGGERERAALALIGVHETTLRRTARRHSLCAEDAEDAYQRAFEILLTKAPTADPAQLIRWMQTVTKHEAMAVRRQRERLLGPPAPVTDPQGTDPIDLLPSERIGPTDSAARSERIARSREALTALKPQEVRALMLKAEGYSYEEIGRITGWSYTKINRCMAEGRKRFLEVYASIEEGRRCEDLAAALSAYCDGEASAEVADEVRIHLRACGHCRAKMRAYRGLPRRVLELLPAVLIGRPWWARAQEWAAGLAGTRQPAAAKAQQLIEAAWAQKAAVAVSVAAVAVGGGAAIKADSGKRKRERPPVAQAAHVRPADPRPLVDAVVEAVPEQRPSGPGAGRPAPQPSATGPTEPASSAPPQEAVGGPGSSGSTSSPPPSRPPPSQVPQGGGQEFGP